MTVIENLFANPLSNALGWALLHFLWQGALVALLLAVILMFLSGRAANLRYATACSALVLMLLLPVLTFWRFAGHPYRAEIDEMTVRTARPPNVQVPSIKVAGSPEQPSNTAAAVDYAVQQQLLAAQLDSALPWLILTWLAGVLCLTARVLGGIFHTHRLMRCHTRLIGPTWHEKLRQLSKHLGLDKSVRLFESALVRVPTTVGWLRPVILLPASVLTGLTTQQLELILAHELAHIRRHDYLVNLVQVVVETLLFYHPAVWWISRQVRIERELACDDLAVAVCGDRVAYARALAKVERLRKDLPVFALAASGGKLSQRIQRLIDNSHETRRTSSSFVGLLLILAVLICLGSVRSVLSTKRQSASAEVGSGASLYESSPLPDTKAIETPRGGDDATALLITTDDTTGEDPEIRRIALTALGNRAGSIIVMDPRTGRVFTIVNQTWAIRRSWKPASIIKLATAAAAIGEKRLQPGERIRLSKNSKPLDLTEALALSVNPYFNLVGERVGPAALINYAREFGLGERTDINQPGEIAGRLPSSLTEVDASHFGAAGEGIEVTPIQLATMVSAIANGGFLIVPHVPRTVQDINQPAQIRRNLGLSPEVLECLRAGMIAAVDHGTGSGASDGTGNIAGKTGTFPDSKSNVGLFASYAPVDDPRLVVVVVTRGPKESGPEAAGIAGAIYRAINRL